jgi:molybdopterin-containing oxidoreductase family membrane subunit
LRRAFPGFKEIIKVKDLEGMAKMIIFTSLIVTYAYVVEFFIAYYSGSPYERALFWYRPFGEWNLYFWLMVFCNCMAPLTLFFKKIRTSIPALFIISLLVNVGMWLERFVIIGTSLAHDFAPFAWGSYQVEWAEIWITIGSFGFFFMWIFLFVKVTPSIAIAEMKETLLPPYRNKK